MAIFKTLTNIIRNSNPKSRSNPFSSIPSLSPLPIAAAAAHRLTSPRSPAAPWAAPPAGPLFLSWPPWKLAQLATPLYFRGKGAAFAQDLIKVRSFPVGLGLRAVEDVIGWKERRREDGGDGDVSVAGDDEKFLNLPNLISISRMVSGPVIGWMILSELYLPAFGALVISGATDWLDGFVARRMGINSVFGSYLDPLADKVLIGCVAVAMVKNDLLHPGLVGLVVLRDVALVSGALYKRASNLKWKWSSWSEFTNLDAIHQEKVEPLLISKVNTVLQLLLVAAALLQPEFGTEQSHMYITYLSWLVATTTVTSSVAYGAQFLRRK